MKPKLLEHLRSIEPRWDAQRASAAQAAIPRRERARRRRNVLAAAALMLTLVAGIWRWAPREDVSISPIGPATRWHEVSATSSLREFSVDEGGAWFLVTPDKHRVVRVTSGEVTVEVLGTRFLVERVGEAVHVKVDHGRVRVANQGVVSELTDGQERWFSRVSEGDARPEPVHDSIPEAFVDAGVPGRLPPMKRQAPKSLKNSASAEWKTLAEKGDYDAAWGALAQAPSPADEPVELLLAADVARLSRHPEGALRPLERLLTRYPTDARAPLAAFTLGRVLLDELGRPREAAAAFARVTELDPRNALVEDAQAREVEACDRAGDAARAHTLALEFERRYPRGVRLRAVRHFGGLE